MSTAITQAIEYARQGNIGDARRLAEANLESDPDDAETWHLLGVLDNIAGSPAEAIEHFQRAIALDPKVAKYHCNFGNALLKTSRAADAERAYRRALELEPGHTAAAYNLASLLHEQDRLAEALAILVPFQNGQDVTGGIDQLLGSLFEKTGQLQKALSHYRSALARNPANAGAWSRLAYLQEFTNQVDEAWASVDRGLALTPDSPSLQVVKARLLRRAKEFEQAIHTLGALALDALPNAIASIALNEWGTNLDRLNRPAEAMEKFIAAKERQARGLPDISSEARAYLAELDRFLALDTSPLARQSAPANDPEPVFLIGFPRSGTTLLDQILDSHPSIQTLEEIPLIATIVDTHPEHFGTTDNTVRPLAPALRQQLQKRYFELAARHVEVERGSVWVDKFPLNITRVHQILQIFPRARFILALRHSCDVVLSTQSHLFNLNMAMAHFQTLEDAARLYAKVMHLWRKFEHDLRPSHHVVRYEDLVSRFEEQIGGVLAFLNLPWDESMRRYAEHARNRERINTPSYHQVVEPLYTRASGRWVRYRRELAPVLPILAPAMQYLGYSASTD